MKMTIRDQGDKNVSQFQIEQVRDAFRAGFAFDIASDLRDDGDMQPHRGTTVLVLGILGLVLCPICGIIAWVMGNGDIKKMESGLMDPEGLGQTKAGKICGIIATILLIVGTIIYGIVIVIAIGAAATQGALQPN